MLCYKNLITPIAIEKKYIFFRQRNSCIIFALSGSVKYLVFHSLVSTSGKSINSEYTFEMLFFCFLLSVNILDARVWPNQSMFQEFCPVLGQIVSQKLVKVFSCSVSPNHWHTL